MSVSMSVSTFAATPPPVFGRTEKVPRFWNMVRTGYSGSEGRDTTPDIFFPVSRFGMSVDFTKKGNSPGSQFCTCERERESICVCALSAHTDTCYDSEATRNRKFCVTDLAGNTHPKHLFFQLATKFQKYNTRMFAVCTKPMSESPWNEDPVCT